MKRLGVLWSRLEAVLGPSWADLGPAGSRLEAIVGRLGAILAEVNKDSGNVA